MAKCLECHGCLSITDRLYIGDDVYTRYWCDFCRVFWLLNAVTGEWKGEEDGKKEVASG